MCTAYGLMNLSRFVPCRSCLVQAALVSCEPLHSFQGIALLQFCSFRGSVFACGTCHLPPAQWLSLAAALVPLAGPTFIHYSSQRTLPFISAVRNPPAAFASCARLRRHRLRSRPCYAIQPLMPVACHRTAFHWASHRTLSSATVRSPACGTRNFIPSAGYSHSVLKASKKYKRYVYTIQQQRQYWRDFSDNNIFFTLPWWYLLIGFIKLSYQYFPKVNSN